MAQTRLAVPSYQPPGGTVWRAWAAQGPSSVGIMIINLKKGDDTNYSSSVDNAVLRARKQGMFVLGYTYTSYGARNPDVIRSRIDALYQNYLVDGIFFDETPTDCNGSNSYFGTQFLYYQQLTNYVRQKQVGARMTVLNPGTYTPSPCWMGITNILVNWESPGVGAYQANYLDYPWVHQYPPDRFWHIVLGVPQSELQNTIELARTRNAGWVYISESPDNAYNQIPVYWTAEATAVAQQGVQAAFATFWPDTLNANNQTVSGRILFRWRAVNGQVWQVFIDADQNRNTGFRGTGVSVGADYMVESSSDGISKCYRYAGLGTDWNWTPIPANAQVSTPESGTKLVSIDKAAIGESAALTYQIRSLDSGYAVLYTSYAIPLSLNNTGLVFDVMNHPQ